MKAIRLDLVQEEIPFEEKHHFAILIFVLSAISPQNFSLCAKKLFDSLQPNGILFFRDYGLYDLA